jgi:hypothetical protein
LWLDKITSPFRRGSFTVTQQMLCFTGLNKRRPNASCLVFLVFRDCRLTRIEYGRGFGNVTRTVRTLDELPDFVRESDWRTRCVSRWWIDDEEMELIDFDGLGINRAVVDAVMLVNGRRPVTTKNLA